MFDLVLRAGRKMSSYFGAPSIYPVPRPTVSVTLPSGFSVRLRPLRFDDGPAWSSLRLKDQEYLQPVEPTVPHTWEKAHSPSEWTSLYQRLDDLVRVRAAVPMAIECDGEFAGQLTLGNIQTGVVSECWIGYWVASDYVGNGIATAACALGVDYGFGMMGLHRITAMHLEDNPASQRVLMNNGFRREGLMRESLHINGEWRDHYLLALLRHDFDRCAIDRMRVVGRIL